MNWERICKWSLKEKDEKLFVTLEVNHIMGTRNFQKESYDSKFVESYLKENNIKFDKLITDQVVYNHHSYEKCTGTWIFSIPSKSKSKKTTREVEKKDNVSKITNKKTIKK